MIKPPKPSIARKLYVGILLLVVVNIGLLWATLNLKTTWLGHTESSDQNHTVSAEQYKDNLLINVIYYQPMNDQINYTKYFFNNKYQIQNNNSYTMSNQQFKAPTLIQRFYALDNQCTLLFRSPVRMLINNVSLICRN